MVTFVLKAQSMSISERLQMVIKMNGMNNTTFAEKIDVQRSSISHVLAGRNKPSIDFIQKILVNFPKVNADWLITGKKIGKGTEAANESDGLSTSMSDSTTVQEEERATYNSARSSSSLKEEESSAQDGDKRIIKVVVFYSDGTFEETLPRD